MIVSAADNEHIYSAQLALWAHWYFGILAYPPSPNFQNSSKMKKMLIFAGNSNSYKRNEKNICNQ